MQTALDFTGPAPATTTGRVRQLQAEGLRAVDAQQNGKHAETIALAVIVARDLIAASGATCGPRVIAEMLRRGWLPADADKRLVGGALHPSRGFASTGEWVPEGSKGRRVPMWRVAA